MPLLDLTAFATTGEVIDGARSVDGATLTVVGQRFVDTVECDDPRLAGTNRLSLDLVVDTSTGGGTVRGDFTWTTARGVWRGALAGTLTGGMVRAHGLARGDGELAGAVLRADWQQVAAHPGVAPVQPAMAFFSVAASLLT